MNKFEEAKLHADMCTVESYNILIDFITSCEETEKLFKRFLSRFESIYHIQDPIKQDQCYDDLFSEILKVGVSND